jgi:hypothetical protein
LEAEISFHYYPAAAQTPTFFSVENYAKIGSKHKPTKLLSWQLERHQKQEGLPSKVFSWNIQQRLDAKILSWLL